MEPSRQISRERNELPETSGVVRSAATVTSVAAEPKPAETPSRSRNVAEPAAHPDPPVLPKWLLPILYFGIRHDFPESLLMHLDKRKYSEQEVCSPELRRTLEERGSLWFFPLTFSGTMANAAICLLGGMSACTDWNISPKIVIPIYGIAGLASHFMLVFKLLDSANAARNFPGLNAACQRFYIGSDSDATRVKLKGMQNKFEESWQEFEHSQSSGTLNIEKLHAAHDSGDKLLKYINSCEDYLCAPGLHTESMQKVEVQNLRADIAERLRQLLRFAEQKLNNAP